MGEGEYDEFMNIKIHIPDEIIFLPHFRFLKWGRREGV